ncbi:MAG: P-II family nitrogen regulator [Spirochaetaceae bacterium]|jgi:nitrogen regulatory protein PII 2|nr:P-II family nitrogen regulator [Spirochaetaceae bacterium]
MKEVMTIIRMNKMNITKKALAEAGITSMYAKECLGRGKGTVEIPRYIEGAAERYQDMIEEMGIQGRLIPKRMINVIVPDKLVKTVVNTMIRVNKTGRSGDGKIFVMPVSESWRVRTGESGDEVLDM